MRNAVEKDPDVKSQHSVLLPAALTGHGQRAMSGPPRTGTGALGMADRLAPVVQRPVDAGLAEPVGHRRRSLHVTVCAARVPHRRGRRTGSTGWRTVSSRQVPQFRASACDALTPPLHRAPPGRRAGSSLAEGPPAGAPLSRGRVPILSFDAI